MADLLTILTPEPAPKNRLQGIDALRLFAALAVVLQHVLPFRGAYVAAINRGTQHSLAGILDITITDAESFAVPFFFMISGYFLCNRVMEGRQPLASLLSYSKRIITVWISWSILYFFVPHKVELLEQGYSYFISSKAYYYGTHLSDLLKNGGVGHFYFFPNLLVGIYLTTLLHLLRVRYLIIAMPALWYCLYLVSLMYPPVSEGAWSSIARSYSFQMFSEGTVFVALGWWLRSTNSKVRTRSSVLISAAGFLFLMLFELLGQPAIARIGVIPYTVGLAMLGITSSSGGTEHYLARFGRYSLGIYASHMLFYFLVSNFGYVLNLYQTIGYYGSTIVHTLFVFSMSLLLSILLSKHKWLRPLVV